VVAVRFDRKVRVDRYHASASHGPSGVRVTLTRIRIPYRLGHLYHCRLNSIRTIRLPFPTFTGGSTAPCRFPNPKIPALRFSALLTEEAPEVELVLL
jgi:hypothetical protein